MTEKPPFDELHDLRLLVAFGVDHLAPFVRQPKEELAAIVLVVRRQGHVERHVDARVNVDVVRAHGVVRVVRDDECSRERDAVGGGREATVREARRAAAEARGYPP